MNTGDGLNLDNLFFFDDKPVAIVTGVTGQDGAYLSQHLLDLNYRNWVDSPVSNPHAST